MSNLPVIVDRNYASVEISNKLRQSFPGGCENILLINPLQTDRAEFELDVAKAGNYPCYPPYNLGLLSKGLEERGYTTSLLDMNYELLKKAHGSNGDFDFENVWEKTIKNRLDAFQPDLAGVSCMFTMNFPEVREISDYVKDYNSRIPVVIGGAYPSLDAKEALMAAKTVDFVSMYESDNSFPDMVDFINGKSDKLSQLATLVNGSYVSLEDRNTPSSEKISVFPQWHDLDLGEYSKLGKIGSFGRWMRGDDISCTTILSNRGCIAHCDFCSVREFNGRGVRNRSIDSVVDEMEHLRDTYNIGHFIWLDDDLISNRKRAPELFSEIAKRDLGITWDASNAVIAAYLTPELAQLAEESGCIGMSFGIESGNPDILKEMRKPATIEKYHKAAEIMREHPNIFSKGFLILGYPGETIGQTWNTIGLAKEMGLDWYSLHIALPLPQTRMAEKLMMAGQMETGSILEESDQTRFMYGFGNMGSDVYKKKRRARDSNFPNPLFDRPKDYVPTRDEVKDIWFLADYYINYEDIPQMTHPIKLELKQKWLEEICEHGSSDNPIGHLYLAVVQEKRGEAEKGSANRELARRFIKKSEFWSTRFKSLGLDEVLDSHVESLV